MLAESPELLTVDEAAALMRITPDSVRDRVKRGTIPAECVVDVIKPVRFRAAKLREWLGLSTQVEAVAERGDA